MDTGAKHAEERADEAHAIEEADASAALARRARALDMLASRFHIEAAFLTVPKIARILGLAPSTIYGYIRAGVFFIPHRMLNETAMVSLDDFVDWYCSGASCEPVADPSIDRRRRLPARQARPAPDPAPEKSTQELLDDALREMGLEPRKRRPRAGVVA